MVTCPGGAWPGEPRRAQSRTGRNCAGRASPGAPWLIALACLAAHAHLTHGCVFPPKWNGRWFQSGLAEPILIRDNILSSKGKCLYSEGDKFTVVDNEGCYKCIVIHEKHINVLQYKESKQCFLQADKNICSNIPGDAVLVSMFRDNASSVVCPFRGAFTFTYNRGHGDCESPVSSVESCTEESRLLLNYQACPDVHGSESAVEELECLATWKEGSLRYLLGKIHHNHATSDEDKYRCFIYDKSDTGGYDPSNKENGEEFTMARSGDATCNGLFSSTEGFFTMILTKVPLVWKCRFPTWMTFPGHWHTLDYSSTYSFHQKNSTLRITNQTGADIKVHCAHVKSSSPSGNSVALVAHWQHHCMGRFVCLEFHRRGVHVVELQVGRAAIRAEDACSPTYFDPSITTFITLVTSNPDAKDCPNMGKFSIAGLKTLQRNARSLLGDSLSEKRIGERNKTMKNHKHSHHKHNKHKSISEDGDDHLSDMERKKIKYQKFLEKIFAKEALKRDHKLALQANSSLHLHNKSYGNDNEGKHHNLSSVEHPTRSRRSNGKADGPACESTEYTMLNIGCNSPENMEFHSSCDNKECISAYSCHGGWSENGTSFLITTPLTRDSIGAKHFCFIYRESSNQMIHFTRSSISCDRSIRPGIDGALVFNATHSGKCLETSSSNSTNTNSWIILLSCLFLYLTKFIMLHKTF